MKRPSTDFIAVHCSATKPSMKIGAEDIRRWHVNDNKWSDIGYHVVIRRDGRLEMGRHLEDTGSHVQGFNSSSVGVCLVGGMKEDDGTPEDNFTLEQRQSLLVVLRFLKAYAPGARIQGHRDFPKVSKACPSFDVREWLSEVAPELI